MEIIHTVHWMKQVGRLARAEGRVAGLVPTMGGLHEGHLSLVRAAQKECSPVVVSVFVNPKQFGPREDFERYPRSPEADRAKLEALGVEYLFAPSAEEMYPAGFSTYVVVEGLGDRLEGRARPGHFRGVTTVVLKLFEIVAPTLAYFGRKDAQQARIVQQMACDLNLDTSIVLCPIAREADGLALSSRNAYLSPAERRAAAAIPRALEAAQQAVGAGEREAARLEARVREILEAEPLASIDYVATVDAERFEPVATLAKPCYLLVAVLIGSTRLIDNLLVEPRGAGFVATL
jgi:pantoate--beta-alanine ligase